MVTENNSQINTFTGGMNTDTAYEMIQDSQYVYSENMRFVSTDPVGNDTGNTHGVMRPIEGITVPFEPIKYTGDFKSQIDPVLRKTISILATALVRNYAIIIASLESIDDEPTDKHRWCVYRIVYGGQYGEETECIYTSSTFTSKKKFEVKLNYEDVDVIKLYIATGENPILTLNVAKTEKNDEYLKFLSEQDNNIDYISSYPSVSFNPPIFKGLTEGSIKPGMVQYSYRLYKTNGVFTEASPSTRLIPIVKDNGDKIQKTIGLLENETSTCGVQIGITVDEENKHFDKIQIYRIHYSVNGQLPQVGIIQDTNISAFGLEILFVDYGQDYLSTITLEEYNSLSGIHIIPKTIDTKNDYMFAANIDESNSMMTDEDIINWDAKSFSFNEDGICTLYDYPNLNPISFHHDEFYSNPDPILELLKDHDCYNPSSDINSDTEDYPYALLNPTPIWNKYALTCGGNGKNINWRFFIKNIQGDYMGNPDYADSINDPFDRTGITDKIDSTNRILMANDILSGKKTKPVFIEDTKSYKLSSYFDTYTSVNYKSLHRGELYRFGIVLYNKYGEKSAVKWIADIKIPQFEIFFIDDTSKELIMRSIGIEFDVTNLPESVVAYEIVRCNRSYADMRTISQGVTSRPIMKFNSAKLSRGEELINQYPYTSTGLLTNSNIVHTLSTNKSIFESDEGLKYGQPKDVDVDLYDASNVLNNNIYQFISPETSYNPDSIITTQNYKLHKVSILCDRLTLENLGAKSFWQRTFILKKDGSKDKNDHDFEGIYYIYNYGVKSIQNLTTPSGGFRFAVRKLELAFSDFPLPDQLKYLHDEYVITLSPDMVQFMYTGAPSRSQWVESLHQTYLAFGNSQNWYIPNIQNQNSSTISFGSIYAHLGNSTTQTRDTKDRLYNYIKLYHIGTTWNGAINQKSKFDVKNVAIALNSNWDDYADAEGKVKKYKENDVIIGNESFCNWILGATYDMDISSAPSSYPDYDDWKGFLKTSMALYATYNAGGKNQDNPHRLCTMYPIVTLYGVGGKSALLDVVDEDRVLTNVQPLATCLCNLIKDTIPYGGYTKSAKDASIYYSYSDFHKKSDPNPKTFNVFNGDTFVMPFEYVSMHKTYWAGSKSTLPSASIIYSIPLETSIDLAHTSGYEWSRNVKKDYYQITNIQTEPSSVYDVFKQDKPLYSYNTAYSIGAKTNVHLAEDYDNNKYVNTIDYRCYNSQLKSANEKFDNWLVYRASNYIDVDSKFGPINKIKEFNNSLYYMQDNATGIIQTNEQQVLSNTNSQNLIIGKAGMLSRYDYISLKYGINNNKVAITNSSNYLYFYDHNKRTINLVAGNQLRPVSDEKNVRSLIVNDTELYSGDVDAFCDNKYDEVVFDILREKSLVFNEKLLQFTSVYNMHNVHLIENGDYQYLYKHRKSGNGIDYAGYNNSTSYPYLMWNPNPKIDPVTGNEDVTMNMPIQLRYVVNKNPISTKVFDNQEIVSHNTPKGFVDQRFMVDLGMRIPKEVFENLRYTWYTDVNYAKANYKDEYGEITDLPLVMTEREGNFRYTIPRQNNAKFLNRVRGKYMVCDIDGIPLSNSSKQQMGLNMSISYIITKFRGSES